MSTEKRPCQEYLNAVNLPPDKQAEFLAEWLQSQTIYPTNRGIDLSDFKLEDRCCRVCPHLLVLELRDMAVKKDTALWFKAIRAVVAAKLNVPNASLDAAGQYLAHYATPFEFFAASPLVLDSDFGKEGQDAG